ncbi:MAG: MotA/TolQ/ExbB proton channel family protein [Firmicutes bacterium]|nr:MotA/TolQ/ExbB proton channel family protein [Bacillota bacterium]
MDGPILTHLKTTLHGVATGLLIPTIIILLLLLALTVIELGGLLVEILTENRRKKVDISQLINQLQTKTAAEIKCTIERSQLLQRQKAVLAELVNNHDLPASSRRALARRLLTAEEGHYYRLTDRTDLIARLAPMFGLMGTLIPLGPGIIALSRGDTQTLADSLLIAFDTTVAGLAAAGVSFLISRWRKRWYQDHLDTLAALMESLLEVFDHGRGSEK